MKTLVYTCVFGDYDRVYPPVCRETGIEYVIVTDRDSTSVPGWRTLTVDTSGFRSVKAPNRFYKMLAHRQLLQNYDVSVYVDGNIRILGRITELAERFFASGAALGCSKHPVREKVHDEAFACLNHGKLLDPGAVEGELAFYSGDGFPDEGLLMETGVLLKNHHHPKLDDAMALWWRLFEKFDSRDQISLPYVLWKKQIEPWLLKPQFREPNPYFGLYPHRRSPGTSPWYSTVLARSFDSKIYLLILNLVHFKWSIQRVLRR